MKSLFSNDTAPKLRNAGGNGLDLPPMWFLVGAYVAACILMAGSWFTVEFAAWSWDRVVVSVLLASALIVCILLTAVEVSSRAAMRRLAENVRTGGWLFGYGMAFVFLSTPLALGIAWVAGTAVDSAPIAGFSAKVAAYIATGLASIVLSTAIVMRLLALTCRGSNVDGTTTPTERGTRLN